MIIIIIGVMLIGVLLALLAYIPSIRRYARSSQSNRLKITFGLTTLTLIIAILSISLMMQTLATISYQFADLNCGFPPPTTEEEEQACAESHIYYDYKDEVINKLFVKYISPPPLRQPCVSDSANICEFIDSQDDDGTWYFGLVGLIISCITCASLTRFITRPLDTEKHHPIGDNV